MLAFDKSNANLLKEVMFMMQSWRASDMIVRINA